MIRQYFYKNGPRPLQRAFTYRELLCTPIEEMSEGMFPQFMRLLTGWILNHKPEDIIQDSNMSYGDVYFSILVNGVEYNRVDIDKVIKENFKDNLDDEYCEPPDDINDYIQYYYVDEK